MLQFLVIAGLLVGLALLLRWFLKTSPQRVAGVVRRLSAWLLLAGGVLLSLRGLGVIGVPMALLGLSMLRARWWPAGGGGGGMGMPGGGAGQGGAQRSEVRTRMLRMELEHASGRMDGEVLQGRFAGRWLSDLADAELEVLWQECAGAGDQSLKLLQAWLQRERPQLWQRFSASGATGATGTAGAGGEGGHGAAHDAADDAAGDATMTPERARQILGLGPDATPEEIKAAHRRLMKVAHPDVGGSEWLARQINLARDVLLREHRR